MDTQEVAQPRNYGNCGECLMNNVEVVKLGTDGVCPKCGADYGPHPDDQAHVEEGQ